MDFIIIANAWSAGKDNPTSKHRIALELIRRGNKVLWIEGSGMRTPSMGSSHDRLRMVRKVAAAFRGVREESVQCPVFSVQKVKEDQNADRSSLKTEHRTLNTFSLWILSPLFIPLPKYELIRRLNGLICRCCMRFWGRWLGFRDPVLINYVPVLAEAMRGWHRVVPQTSDLNVGGALRRGDSVLSGACQEHRRTECASHIEDKPKNQEPRTKNPRCAPRIVYHCVDRWDAFSNYDSQMMAEMDRRCCELADVVIASSRDLVERCRRYNTNVHLVSHGVDHDHFFRALQATQRPADLPPGRVAGFFGLLSEWFDQELLIEVARQVPECEIVLIGKADVPIDRLKGIRNVHLLGPRPFSQLPAYIAHFDVGLIPFVINELTLAVNPIKLREMLSAGCPVVSTDLPEVHAYKGRGLVVGESARAFAVAVADRARNPLSLAERAHISAGVADETWQAKVDEILALLNVSSCEKTNV